MSKFQPKLDEHARRQLMAALYSDRWPFPVIRTVFDVSETTTMAFRNPERGLYKDIFVEYNADPQAFMVKYLSAELADTLNRAAEEHIKKLADRELERMQRRVKKRLQEFEAA